MQIGFGIVMGSLIALGLAIWLAFAYKKNGLAAVKYISYFFSLKFLALGFLALGSFNFFHAELDGWFLRAGLQVMHFTLVPLALLTSELWFPRFKKAAFIVFLFGAIIASASSFFVGRLSIGDDLPQVTGYFGIFYLTVSHIAAMILPGLMIFFSGLTIRDKKIIFRSILLGSGLILAAMTGILLTIFGIFQSSGMMLGAVNAIGHIMIAVGVLIRPSN